MKNIRRHYGETQILDLNLLGVSGGNQMKLSAGVLFTLGAPVMMMGLAALTLIIPEFGFMAECVNVPGGDICSISIK
jgi:hypothetical protein